jgi:hypothetical protein
MEYHTLKLGLIFCQGSFGFYSPRFPYSICLRFAYGADGLENVPHREWVSLFVQVVDKVKMDMEEQGREDEFVGAKVLLSFISPLQPWAKT